ncbi:MAG TPA: T9SS type A sorting domain-containing protein [bacterium]|nr:T9SS type A sorting domain-containing protein [bacterium]HOH06239.1 T9SS type A sorting domain-containing protein [bacterium]HOY43646.1 T9SS type A sorting domain-containing protein [bacterium]HPG81826.1 T9SS type A sorting domain-containing protein [bacterium]HPM59346.1 T9SS type A sorting domain-containing protein [bacterium]
MKRKFTYILFGLLLLGLCGAALPQEPHIIGGKFLNPDGSVPAGGEIRFQAYLQKSPGDTSAASWCSTGGGWSVEVKQTPMISYANWEAGDTLVVVFENVLETSPYYGARKVVKHATTEDSPEFVGSISLPVELTTFTAAVKNTSISDVVMLEWRTVGESNNLGFEVERSLDGKNFSKLGFVAGAGSTNLAQGYDYRDDRVEVGTYFYRLKQIDRNGSFTYSDIREVEVTAPQRYELTQNFPNPFNPQTDIVFRVKEEGVVTLKVFDLLGREVKTLVNEKKGAGVHRITFDAHALPSGVYLYSITMGSFHDVKKMLLVK